MGIEDFTLDSDKHAQRVLVIAASHEEAQRIGKLLETRSYAWKSADGVEAASELAGEQLFDMVVAQFDGVELPPIEAISSITSNARLRRVPLLVLHPGAGDLSPNYLPSLELPVSVLATPWHATDLLVKVSSQLRLQKLKFEESSFVAKVSAQNSELRDLTNRFQRELQEAQNIQNSILPKSLPTAAGSAFSAAYVPLEAVGGDLYDFWKIRDDRIGLFIGDVTGHGLSAAFIGAMTKMALSYASKDSPELMLQEMNEGLLELMPEGRFVTAAAAIYTPSTGELLVARGGHPAGYIWRAAGKFVTEVAPRGFPLGVVPHANYELYTAQLLPGDKFIFVTDGLTETVNMAGKALGTAGTGTIFGELAETGSIEQCVAGLLDRQEVYSEGRIVKDDITLIGIERLP